MERIRAKSLPGGQVRGLFTFALLVCFALLSLLIVLLGVRVYETIEERAAVTHGSRTALLYLAGKVRAADPAGIAIMEQEGGQVLVIAAEHEGERYHTYIYRREGVLCEYFGSASRAFDPAFGEAIIPAEGFEAAWAGPELLRLTVDGHAMHLYAPGGGDGT